MLSTPIPWESTASNAVEICAHRCGESPACAVRAGREPKAFSPLLLVSYCLLSAARTWQLDGGAREMSEHEAHDERDGATVTDEGHAPLDVEAVRAQIAGLQLGWPCVYFPVIGSTNSHATQLARE